MNMIIGKKQIVLASLVAALGVAVYLNYQFADKDMDLVTASTTDASPFKEEVSLEDEDEDEDVEHYGDAQFVNSQDVDSEIPAGENSEEYFSKARLSRTKTRDEAAAALQVMLSDTKLNQEQKDELTEQAGAMAESIAAEGKIENLIEAKGFEDCMVYCSSSKVDVIVKSDELKDGDVVQIRDIILSQTKIPVENISIVPVK